MKELIKTFKQNGIIPVVKLENPDNAIQLTRSLLKGGITCIEITFRSAAAEESIRRISKEVTETIVGAGTVLTIEQAEQALQAGAKFLVTPGFHPKIVDFAQSKDIPIFPGVNTPTSIEAALEKGLKILKFFPAEQSGGCKILKAFGGPYQSLKFIPTGGIKPSNLNDYLSLPNVLACGGSWLVNPKLIEAKNFEEIERLATEAVDIMLDFKLSCIGINTNSEKEAINNANEIYKMFKFPLKMEESSIFNGEEFEWIKNPSSGKHGHICIATKNIEGAIAYLERKGICTKAETREEENGELTAIYLDIELGGFAFCLVEKK